MINMAATVPYQGSFLILGGFRIYGRANTVQRLTSIMRYRKNGEWEQLPISLRTARSYHIAIPKPAC